jgi:hypothetical protein
MSLEIKVDPRQLASIRVTRHSSANSTARSTGRARKVSTSTIPRLVSRWTIYANGEPRDLLNGGTPTSLAARVFLTTRDLVTEQGRSRSTRSACTQRVASTAAWHEDLDLTNYARTRVHFNLEISVRSDFARRPHMLVPYPYMAAIAIKSEQVRLAPPTNTPLTFSTAINSAAFEGVTDPP